LPQLVPSGSIRARRLFGEAVFDTALNLGDVWVQHSWVRFKGCMFERSVSARGILVEQSLLAFLDCVFTKASVDFRHGQFGALAEVREWREVVFGRKDYATLGSVYFLHCELEEASLTMDDVILVHGQILIHDVVLQGGTLRIKPTETRHQSIELRRIETRNADVDVPVPERYWKGRVTGFR
jgi:hypothetical protein